MIRSNCNCASRPALSDRHFSPTELDISNAADLQAALLDAAARSPTVIVDMTATEFCDASGVHVLLRAAERMAGDHGGLRLVVATPLVTRVLAVLGVDRILAIFPSVLDAVISEPGPAQAFAALQGSPILVPKSGL